MRGHDPVGDPTPGPRVKTTTEAKTPNRKNGAGGDTPVCVWVHACVHMIVYVHECVSMYPSLCVPV